MVASVERDGSAWHVCVRLWLRLLPTDRTVSAERPSSHSNFTRPGRVQE